MSSSNDLTILVVEEGNKYRTPKDSSLIIVEIGKDIRFSPSALDNYSYSGWKPVHHDLLVVSSAVEYADRKKRRTPSRWHRNFKIVAPVNDISRWRDPEVDHSLRDALKKLTGDNWILEFYESRGVYIDQARQRHLPFGKDKEFAIAYSDGLDSRCVTGIYEIDGSAVKVRVSNQGRDSATKEPFDKIPFSVKAASNESSQRTRGFKFAAATAIAAHLAGIQRIIVPESGQGALGPVLIPIHNVYADYRNHPAFFRRMERFIGLLLNYKLSYEQPRLWSTKGETIREYLVKTGAPGESLYQTRSCWQKRWNIQSSIIRSQCGLCAACLLRRVSMFSAGLHEPSDSYMFSDLSKGNFHNSTAFTSNSISYSAMIQYGTVGARHLQQLSQMSEKNDQDLLPYAHSISRELGTERSVTLDNLRMLLTKHSKEWNDFVSSLGPTSFLRDWIIGGRHV